MNMRYAIVKNNLVENVIVWDGKSPYTPPNGTIVIASETAEIGFIYNSDTGEFYAPVQEGAE